MNTEPSGSSIAGDVYVQRFSVSFDYPVWFTRHVFSPDNRLLADCLARRESERRHRCIAFVDDGLLKVRPELPREIRRYFEAHRGSMELVAEPTVLPGGERIKSELYFVEQVMGELFDHRIDRQAFVLAVGGGALLDAVGLVAATTHRGVRLVRVPTTVLAQNDSGVGVKNGVNLRGVKNFVGTFQPPFAVLNDLDFIELLPPREKISGMAEAVKVALIRDGAFFRWLEAHADALALFELPAMARMIRRTAELHMRQIALGGDPFEFGSARPLDFGHWAAHKLESLSRHHLRHGEAVAIGIALDARYSVLAGMLAPGLEERIAVLLEHLGFRLWHPALEGRTAEGQHALLDGLREFREHLGGELTVTLLEDLGTGVEVHEMDEDKILASLRWLAQRVC